MIKIRGIIHETQNQTLVISMNINAATASIGVAGINIHKNIAMLPKISLTFSLNCSFVICYHLSFLANSNTASIASFTKIGLYPILSADTQ